MQIQTFSTKCYQIKTNNVYKVYTMNKSDLLQVCQAGSQGKSPNVTHYINRIKKKLI